MPPVAGWWPSTLAWKKMIYEETNEAILSFLETWVETLANGETSKALEMIVSTPIPVKDYGFRRLLVNLHLREPAKPFSMVGRNS